MPLQRQLLQTGFRFGIDEGTDPHQVPFGTLTRAENARWKKSGRIEKRSGLTALSSAIVGGGSLTFTTRLFPRGSELCSVSGDSAGRTRLMSYDTGYGWRDRGPVPDIGVTQRNAIDTTGGVAVVDSAVFTDAAGDTLVAVAWIAGDPVAVSGVGAYVTIQDATTGAVVVAPTQLLSTTASAIRVLYVNSTVVVLCRNGSNVSAWTIPVSTFTVSGVTNLRTDAAAGAAQSGFDACVIGSNFGILYNDNTAITAVVKLYTYTSALAAVNNAPIVSTNDTFLALASDGTYVHIGANQQMTTRDASTLTVTGATIALPGEVLGICAPGGAASGTVVVSYLLGATIGVTPAGVGTVVVPYAGPISATTKRATYGTRALSRPWKQDGKILLILGDDTLTAAGGFAGLGTYVVEAELTDASAYGTTVPHRYVAKLDQLVGGTMAQGVCCPLSVNAVTSTTFYFALPFMASAPAQNASFRQGVRLTTLSSGASLPADTWRAVSYGGETYLAAGVLSAYDGATCFDYGFSRAPVAISSIAAAGGFMAAGTYLYGVCAEYRSKAGVLHRSTTSGHTQSGVPASGKVTISYTLCNVTGKQSLTTGYNASTSAPINLTTFRSVVSGSTLQRLTIEPTYNVTTVGLTSSTQSFVDTSADASVGSSGITLASRPVIYTTGGILDDVQPPACSTLALYRQRLWAVGPDRRTVWFSKSFQDDIGTAPGFNEAFRITADRSIVALASMDDKLIAFYSDGIAFLAGDGPLPSGQGSDFLALTQIQTDVGCLTPRSVISTPDGVIFQAQSGALSVLSRGLEVSWFGKPVQDVLASYPNITSAVLVPTKNEVRITCNNSAGTAHTVLVWNYVERQWSTFRYLGGNVAIADACLCNGVYTLATTAGAVYQEDATTYLDAGAYVSMVLETAWVSAAGPLAFQSVREFQMEGLSNSNHDMTVEVGFENETSYTQSATFLAGSSVTAVGPLEECTIAIGNRRKSSHLRFRMTDTTPTNPGTYPVGTGQGPSFDAIGIEVGIKQGFSTNPATKRG